MRTSRVGLIVPSSNVTMEVEFHSLIPKSVTLHVARMRMPRHVMFQRPEEIDLLEDEAEKAAVSLADAEVHSLAYGCTTGSFYKGLSHDTSIKQRLKKASRVSSVVTTAGAIVDALQSLCVKRLLVLTPYVESTNVRMKAFLEDAGFSVLRIVGMDLTDNMAIAETDQTKTLSLAERLQDSNAEALLISCTNLRTLDIIDKLEEKRGVPVLSSNTCTIWGLLAQVLSSISLTRGGRLLRGS